MNCFFNRKLLYFVIGMTAIFLYGSNRVKADFAVIPYTGSGHHYLEDDGMLEKQELEKILLSNIFKNLDTGCWEWQGSIMPVTGYGRFKRDGRTYKIHRISAHLYLGLDLNDSKICACHHCDNKICANPDHIFLGDYAANNKDRSRKGRTSRHFLGQHHTEATKQKLSNINKGKKISYETKLKLSRAFSGENNHRYGDNGLRGKKHSEETKYLMSISASKREKDASGRFKAKLTVDQVKFIKKNRNIIINKTLAKMFGVGPSTIASIHQNRNWSWVKV